MEQLPLKPKLHVFVCINLRPEGEACCSAVHGVEVFRALKRFALANFPSTVWITKTGCMGYCNDEGCTVVIHPQNLWFSKVTVGDLPAIQEKLKTLYAAL